MAEIVENCPESPKGTCTGECLPKGYHEEDVIELHPTENISEELIMSNSQLDSSTETKPDSGIEGRFFNCYKTFISENNCCKISIQKKELRARFVVLKIFFGNRNPIIYDLTNNI